MSSRVVLTKEQALSMLGEGETIHTFRLVGLAKVGYSLSRAVIMEAIESSACELGGPECQKMNHGLVILVDGVRVFVECKSGLDYCAFERECLASETQEVESDPFCYVPEVMKCIKAIESIYASIGRAMYDEPRDRLASKINTLIHRIIEERESCQNSS